MRRHRHFWIFCAFWLKIEICNKIINKNCKNYEHWRLGVERIGIAAHFQYKKKVPNTLLIWEWGGGGHFRAVTCQKIPLYASERFAYAPLKIIIKSFVPLLLSAPRSGAFCLCSAFIDFARSGALWSGVEHFRKYCTTMKTDEIHILYGFFCGKFL